jgi:hypothetical protein
MLVTLKSNAHSTRHAMLQGDCVLRVVHRRAALPVDLTCHILYHRMVGDSSHT